jgi:ATP-dependent Zn protease
MTNKDRRSAAYHEAGHAIVAIEVGLPVAEVWIDCDDPSAGGMTPEPTGKRLSKVDGMAICLAGKAAGEIFDAPMDARAYWFDRLKLDKLTKGLSKKCKSALERAAYQRAVELLKADEARVHRVAKYLIKYWRIDGNTNFKW